MLIIIRYYRGITRSMCGRWIYFVYSKWRYTRLPSPIIVIIKKVTDDDDQRYGILIMSFIYFHFQC